MEETTLNIQELAAQELKHPSVLALYNDAQINVLRTLEDYGRTDYEVKSWERNHYATPRDYIRDIVLDSREE